MIKKYQFGKPVEVSDNTRVQPSYIISPIKNKHYSEKYRLINLGGNPEENIKKAEREKQIDELKRRFGLVDDKNPFAGLNKTFGTAISAANLFYGGGWALNRLLRGNKASPIGQFFGKYVLPSNALDNVNDGIEFIFNPTLTGGIDLGTGLILSRYKDFSKPSRQIGELIGQGANINNMKIGGMLQLLKKGGSEIHIKEKNKGSFTRWCGGNVTEECIRRGKASSNPKIRKKATFADNARHFKHRFGGQIVREFKLRKMLNNIINN